MAVTLASLCEKSGYLYGMRVIAGKDGMTNLVQWVHSVEDTEVSDFLHGGEYAPEKRRADAAYVIRQGEFLQPSVKIRKELFLSLFAYRVGTVGYIHIENDIRYIPAVRYHRYSAVYRHIKGYVAHLPLFAFPLTSFTSRRYTLVLDAHELSGL